MSENVYERHEDVMMDAAGDVANRATDLFFWSFRPLMGHHMVTAFFSQKAWQRIWMEMRSCLWGCPPDSHQWNWKGHPINSFGRCRKSCGQVKGSGQRLMG